MTSVGSTSGAPISPAARSPWHSPVPYLFGGLAAMLGLIAFALLILACSYWKLSGYLEGEADDRDLEAGETDGDACDEKPSLVYEPKFLVIMAGQEKPTCLATPASSRTSSFGTNGCGNETMSVKGEGEDFMEMMKEGTGDQVQVGNMESHGPSDQVP